MAHFHWHNFAFVSREGSKKTVLAAARGCTPAGTQSPTGQPQLGSRSSVSSGMPTLIKRVTSIVFTAQYYDLQDNLQKAWQPKLLFPRDISWGRLSEFMTLSNICTAQTPLGLEQKQNKSYLGSAQVNSQPHWKPGHDPLGGHNPPPFEKHWHSLKPFQQLLPNGTNGKR